MHGVERARGPWDDFCDEIGPRRAWHLLLFSAAGFLAPQLADCEPLDPRIGDDCVCGLSFSFSLPLFVSLSFFLSLLFSVCLSGDSNAALLRESDALPVAVRQQLDRRNRRRWRPAGVSSQKWLSPIAPSLRDARVRQVCLSPSRRLAACPRNSPSSLPLSLSPCDGDAPSFQALLSLARPQRDVQGALSFGMLCPSFCPSPSPLCLPG